MTLEDYSTLVNLERNFVDEIKNINNYNNLFGFKISLSIISQILRVKIQSKETPMGGNFLKLYFCVFEKSQGEHNSLIVNIFLE
jgi:hypothetical protein